MASEFEKKHFRTSKRKRTNLASNICVLCFSEQIYFLYFFEREYASKC